MIHNGLKACVAGLGALAVTISNCWADTNQSPDFQEVFALVREHLKTDTNLDQVAVKGFLSELNGRVSIADSDAVKSSPLTSRTSLIDDGIAFVRVERVAAGLAEEIGAEIKRLSATNQVNGVVIDLRYAGGHDYEAAAEVATLFTAKEGVLLDWGSGSAQAKTRSDAITKPVAVLVNRQTSGAAEALAAVMRQTGAGLVLGSVTSGSAMAMREFPLKNGQRLLIAMSPVKLADGTALAPQGVTPDIQVSVSEEAERRYFQDAFAEIERGGSMVAGGGETNHVSRRTRVNEADLVRERREWRTNANSEMPQPPERQFGKPLIRDPVLARAVDLLKGLAVVRGVRS